MRYNTIYLDSCEKPGALFWGRVGAGGVWEERGDAAGKLSIKAYCYQGHAEGSHKGHTVFAIIKWLKKTSFLSVMCVFFVCLFFCEFTTCTVYAGLCVSSCYTLNRTSQPKPDLCRFIFNLGASVRDTWSLEHHELQSTTLNRDSWCCDSHQNKRNRKGQPRVKQTTWIHLLCYLWFDYIRDLGLTFPPPWPSLTSAGTY